VLLLRRYLLLLLSWRVASQVMRWRLSDTCLALTLNIFFYFVLIIIFWLFLFFKVSIIIVVVVVLTIVVLVAGAQSIMLSQKFVLRKLKYTRIRDSRKLLRKLKVLIVASRPQITACTQ
jgi:hypothetical protein